MNAPEEIFDEYVSMRENGMSSKDTLTVLRPYIAPLSNTTKKPLADAMREWERKAKEENSIAASTKKVDATAPQQLEEDINWVECPSCGKKNRADAVFCFSCGLLMDIYSQTGTKLFTDSLGQRRDYFGKESVLVIRAPETNHEYELHPQNSTSELLVGRASANNAITPDIDLSEADGENLGVSRLHLSIKYVEDGEAIEIYDLNSANGAFVNGQRLHPKEVRILRDGDELQLGKLVLWVAFYHPGNEVT
jgi:hypothetical protein